MAYCPTYTNPQVKADFNSIVEDYGGKPLSNMEFRSRKLRGERFGKDKFAMDVAYYMWDKHQGNMEQIFADKEGAKYRLSKPTEVYEQVEDVDLSLDHLTDAERSYLEAEATIYDPFADEERVYDTHKDRKRVTYVQNIESTPNTNLVLQNNKQQQVSELFDSNPELANEVYEAAGFKTNITQDDKSYYRGQVEKPIINKEGNLILYAKEDELYKRAELKSKGVSMTEDLQSAIEYGNGQLEVSKNLASEENIGVDLERELDRLDENGYYLIQIPKNISNEIVKEAGEVKVIGDKIVIPKGQYKIEQVIDGVDTQITPEQKQQAQQLYSEYLDTIFPDSKVKDIVYHGLNANMPSDFKFNLQTFVFDKSLQRKGSMQGMEDGIFFSNDKEFVQNNFTKYGLFGALLNIKNPKIKGEVEYWKDDIEYLTTKEESLGGKSQLDYLAKGVRPTSWNKYKGYEEQVEGLKKDGYSVEEVDGYFIRLSKLKPMEEAYFAQLKKAIDNNAFPYHTNMAGKIIQEAIKNNQDGVIFENLLEEGSNNVHNQYVVFEPEQIHILGSKQDIEQFKSWVDGNQSNVQYQKQIDLQAEQDSVLEEFANSLSERFNISFDLISEEEAKSISPEYANEPAFFDPKTKKAYLVKSKANKTSAIHEIFTHPFLLQIEKTNPTLYKNLLKEAKNNKSVVDYVDNLYGTNQNNDHEYIARAIDLAVQGELNQQKDKTLLERIQDFFNQLYDYLKKLFNIPEVFSSAISPNITLQQLAQFAMYGKGKMNLNPAQENIEYSLKATNVIVKNLDKIKQWEKNKSISEDVLWNKIQGLGVPKEQIELVKNSEGNTVEEKLLDFANEYGNTWNEVVIDENRDNQNIVFQKTPQSDSSTQYQLPQGREIEEFVASEKTIRDLNIKVSDNMSQQDHIDNMMKLRENIAATEVDINEVSEETLKRLQLNPEIDKVKRVYANLKTGEIVAEMSTTDKVTIKKLKHTSREELRELTAKYQGDLKSEWGSRNHLTLERFTEYFISTESFSNILKNDDVGYNADLLSLKNIHKESRLNAKDSRELQLGVEDMLNWINEMQKDIDPKGKAKILTEQVLVNPKDGTAGTADLVVIFSDGSYGQLDFKTMYPNFNMWGSKTEGGPEVITHPNWIHMNRKEEFRIQLMANNHTLEDVYGLGKRRFSRVIPIAVRLGWNAKEGVNTDNVTQLRMARSNRESQNLYGVEMLPLALGEKIGIKELDAEMNKLYDVFQNKQIELSTMSVSNPKFSLLKQEVENLDKAINSAIIRKDLYYLRKDIKRLINLYHEKFEGLKDIDSEYVDGRPNPSFLETGEITELRHMIEVYQTILATSGNYFREFKLDETNQKEFLAYTEELGELSSVLSMMDLALREKMVERSMDDIDMERLKDSLDPSFTQANFREGSEQMHAVTQKFMTEVLKANDMRRIDRQRVEKKIISAKNNFEKWASSKGMSLQEGYNSILTEKTANFASQFTHEFWEDMDKAMKTKDNKWLNEHFQLREDAEEVYKTNRQNFINRGYTAEEVTRWEENNQIEDAKYNPRRWRMYYEIKDRLPTEYYTEQYGELLKPGNEPALEFYHTMLDFMKEAKSMMGIGYAEGIPYNLLPNIRADLLQQFLDYGFNFDSVKEIFTSNFNTRPDDIHFGSTMNLTRRVNPITGEFLPEVPILYTTPIRNKKGEIDNTLKSRDIAKSVLIFYDMALNYKYMTEKVEPYVEAWRDLIAIEGNRAMTEGGKNILTPTEEQHRIGGHKTRALETFNNLVDYHVYGIRIPSSGVSRKQQKTIMSLKSWHAKKELAFAPIAQIGNFTQIRAGAFFTGLAGFHYTTRQFRRASNMRMRKNELYRALVQFIEPSPGRAGIVTKNIASRKVSKIVNWDTAFWGFRKGEETVNDDVLVAMMMNYGFDENGNIRRLKRLPEGTKSLFENSRIEDGRIVIDGIIDSEGNVNYDAYTALRRLVKGVSTDIKGQPDSQNPQGINLKLWGNTMMQYKGWMPGMVYARLGDIHYSPDRQTLVEGKFRSLMSDLKSDTEKSIAGFIFTEALPRLIQFTALMPVMMVAGKGYSINKARAEMDFKRFQAKFPNDPYIKELNFDDFLDYRQGQIRSLAAELTTILSLIAMILAMSASWKDDDDPWFSQNYLTRTTFRLVHRAKREIAFMVDFNSWTNTFLQTPMPILGYITDLTKLWSSTMDQIGDDIHGKDIERDGLAGALYGRNIGGSARDKKGRFYETMRWGPLNKTFKFFETHTAHRESIY